MEIEACGFITSLHEYSLQTVRAALRAIYHLLLSCPLAAQHLKPSVPLKKGGAL